VLDQNRRSKQPAIEVLHFSTSKPAVNIEVGQGIQVLYGRNGVGKTRILRSLPESSITVRRLETPDLSGFSGFGWGYYHSSFFELLDGFQDASLFHGFWSPDFASVQDTVERLKSEFGFVETLPLSLGLKQRIYAVISALVYNRNQEDGTAGNDPIDLGTAEQIVATITEWLTTPLVTFWGGRSLTYRVVLSEAPATTALLQKSADAMQRRFEELKENDFEDANPDGQDWLDVLLGQNLGVLFEYLLDDPLDAALNRPPRDSFTHVGIEKENGPIGKHALDDKMALPVSLPFTFVDELDEPYPAIERAISEMYSKSDFAVEVIRNRLTDPEDLEYFEERLLEDRLDAIRSYFKGSPWEVLFDSTGPSDACAKLCGQFSSEVNRLYSMVLDGAPELVVEGRPPATWTGSTRFACRARDRSGVLVDLESLSVTQRRWANFAIQLATASPDGHSIIILDEPELGLHRRAETHLVDGLHRISKDLDATVVVASHSPAFLRPDMCTLHHVDRNPDNGNVRISAMGAVGVSRVSELGLHPADLLQNIRTILLVEGQHEVWVLDQLFGEEFQRHGVLVSPLRGAKLLKSAVDAHLLFDFTDANVVVMLDNESTDRVEMIWNEALVAKASGDHASILKVLDQLQEVRTGEARYLKDFCMRAIELDARHRIGFQMMKETDLDRYFPPSAFIRKQKFSETAALSWEAIDDLYRDWLENNSPPPGGHKEWLRRNYGADFNEKNYRRAVRELDHLPDDFTELFQRLCGSIFDAD